MVANEGEHRVRNAEVEGSIPFVSTRTSPTCYSSGLSPSVVSQAQHMAQSSQRNDRLKAAWTPALEQRWQTEEPICLTWESA